MTEEKEKKEEQEIKCAYNRGDYFHFVKELHPEWRCDTMYQYADKLIDVCEILGITLKDLSKEEPFPNEEDSIRIKDIQDVTEELLRSWEKNPTASWLIVKNELDKIGMVDIFSCRRLDRLFDSAYLRGCLFTLGCLERAKKKPKSSVNDITHSRQ